MKQKKILSILLCIAMMFTLIPVNALAYVYDDGVLKTGLTSESQLPTYSFEFFDDDQKAITAKDLRNLKEDETFYFAVKATNFDNFAQMSTWGLKNMDCKVTFNDTYFTPVETKAKTINALYADWEHHASNSMYTDGFIKATNVADSDSLLGSAVTKSGTTLTFKPSITQGQQPAMSNVEYVGLVQMKRTGAAAPAEGVEDVFIFQKNTTQAITLGKAGSTAADDPHAWGADTHLENYLVLDESAAENIFPATYTVDFYKDSTLRDKVGEQLSVEGGDTIGDDKVPAESAFTAPDNSFFSGLKYVVGEATPAPSTDPAFVADDGKEGTTPTKITGNTKVYATYEIGHKVTFHSNDGEDKESVVYVNKSDGKVTTPDDAAAWRREGYVLTGWTTDAEGKNSFNNIVEEDTDVYAQWSANITVTFDYNYDDASAAVEKTLQPNTALGTNVPDDPTREGYDFKGWNTKSNGTGESYTKAQLAAVNNLTENTTYYAIWDVNQTTIDNENYYTLTFDPAVPAGETVSVTPSSIKVKKGDKIIAAQMPDTPNRGTGYTFEGWFEGAEVTNNQKVEAPITLDGDKTAYAHWQYDENAEDAVTVTLKAPDANPAVDTKIVLKKNASVGSALPTTLTRENYSFDKWVREGTTTEFTSTEAVTADVTVEAAWLSNLTIKYDVNGGTGEIADLSGAPASKFKNPTTAPTRANYKLTGWNTARNGSGTAVTEAMSLSEIKTAAAADGTDITVYAQWSAVDDEGKPNAGSVTITFDANLGTNSGTVDITPATKIIMVTQAIGVSKADGMSNLPTVGTREGYDFKGWSADPTAVLGNVDEETEITASMCKDNEDGTYSLTLYAIWSPDAKTIEDGNSVEVRFYKNDGTENEQPFYKKAIRKGDKLSAIPDDPTRTDGFTFVDWYTDKTEPNLDKLTPFYYTTQAITADTDVYGRWNMPLYVVVTNDGQTYTGNPIPVEFDVYKAVRTDSGAIDKEATKKDENKLTFTEAELAANFLITYDNSETAPSDAGTYKLDIGTKGDYKLSGVEVEDQELFEYTIAPADVTVTITSGTQEVKKATPQTYLDYTLSVEGLTSSVEYKLWEDKDEDGVIDDGELGSSEAAPTEVGVYVAAIKLANKNYTISNVTGATYAENVYKAKAGENIKFEIKASDPTIKAPKINSVADETVSTDELPLYSKDTFANADKTTFVEGENPATDEYYIRVTDTDADSIQFVIETVSDTTEITVTKPSTGATATKGSDGKWTVTVPLTESGKTMNEIVINATNGSGNDAPTQDYTFNVQLLKAPTITLEYGNSPYGEIMKATNITDKEEAKKKFNEDNTFKDLDAKYVPTSLASNPSKYTLQAWGDSVLDTINMDRNEHAIFIYEGQNVAEPLDTGFTATDSLGNDVSGDVVRTVEIMRLSGNDVNEDVSKKAKETITIANGSSRSLQSIITGNLVRPDVYDMKYTYTDSLLGAVTVTRKIIVIPRLGDVNMVEGVNGNDAVPINSQVQELSTIIDATKASDIANLFLYRVCDVNQVEGVNGNDAVPINSQVQELSKIIDFYNSNIKEQ